MGYLIPVRDTPLGLARLGELLGRCRRRRRHLVSTVQICRFPENKNVYVQKINTYVQKVKVDVFSMLKMEYVIDKEILKRGKSTSGFFCVRFVQKIDCLANT